MFVVTNINAQLCQCTWLITWIWTMHVGFAYMNDIWHGNFKSVQLNVGVGWLVWHKLWRVGSVHVLKHHVVVNHYLLFMTNFQTLWHGKWIMNTCSNFNDIQWVTMVNNTNNDMDEHWHCQRWLYHAIQCITLNTNVCI